MLDNETPAAPDNAVSEPSIEEIAAQVFGQGDSVETTDQSEATEVAAPKAVEPTPAAVSASSRIIAAKRADLKAAQARAEMAKERAELQSARAELEDMRKTADALKAARVSPSKALELLGMSPREFLESLATEHEPEAVVQRAMGAAMTETEKLRLEIAEMKAAQAERERAAESRTYEAQSSQAQQAFLEHIASSESYPHTVEEFTPSEIVKLGWELATKHSAAYFERFGEYPSDEVIAEELENQAKARAAERSAWRARKVSAAPSKGIQSGNQRAAQPVTGPVTLTSRASSERTSVPSGWSQEQADEESLRILQAALRTG